MLQPHLNCLLYSKQPLRERGTLALIVGNNFHPAVLVDTHLGTKLEMVDVGLPIDVGDGTSGFAYGRHMKKWWERTQNLQSSSSLSFDCHLPSIMHQSSVIFCQISTGEEFHVINRTWGVQCSFAPLNEPMSIKLTHKTEHANMQTNTLWVVSFSFT